MIISLLHDRNISYFKLGPVVKLNSVNTPHCQLRVWAPHIRLWVTVLPYIVLTQHTLQQKWAKEPLIRNHICHSIGFLDKGTI